MSTFPTVVHVLKPMATKENTCTYRRKTKVNVLVQIQKTSSTTPLRE